MAQNRVEVALEFPLTLKAGESLTAGTMVKVNSSGEVITAVGGDKPLGWVEYDASSGDYVAVEKLEGIINLLASDTITCGHYVKCTTAGKVAHEATETTPTAFTIGQAASAGTNGALMKVACF